MTTSTTPDADYAFWAAPGSSFKVTYSLATFHEIDFVVNEGYRRIPHGGIEMGGLLFGHSNQDGLRIETFRPIECEHASGPSFNLSEKDIAGLEQQISAAASDPELSGLQVLGWFIAHTRGPLKFTEKEKLLFDRLFPGANRLTVLIKPERFRPTRFGFLVRDQTGQVNTDATATAIILPGRGTQGREGPVPSIAAPPETSATRPPERTSTDTTTGKVTFVPPPEPNRETQRPAPIQHAARIAMPENIARPEPESLPIKPASPAERPALATSLASRNVPDIELPRSRKRYPVLHEERKSYGIQFVLVLLIAALLGCCVGYWAYLQLPSPVISLAVQKQENTLLVSWSPTQTRTSAYAAIRVDDGEPVALSSAEKAAGRTAVVNSANDVKIELIAQHWLRDSRGIVRFVNGAQNGSSEPSTLPSTQPASSGSARSQLP